MNLTTRDDFKKKNKVPPKPVEIPELGTVFFRQPTGGEWLRCMERLQNWQRIKIDGPMPTIPPDDLTYLVIGVALSDAEGNRVFPDDSLAEIAEIPPPTLEGLYLQAFQHVFQMAGDTDTEKKD